jgi:cell division protein FtsL
MSRSIEDLLEQHLHSDNKRLDRIEEKIDKLSDTVVALARVEEKIISMDKAQVDIAERIDIHEARLDRHDERLARGAISISAGEKIFWTVLVAVISGTVGWYLR